MKPKEIVLLVFVVLFLIVTFQNAHTVALNLFFWKISVSKIVLIFIVMLCGILLGWAGSRYVSNKRR
jgi:uncharacterized integral membrane protein